MPGPVIGGVSIVVFGLIAATGGRIWVDEPGRFLGDPQSDHRRGRADVLGAGNFTLHVGGFTLGGIGTATFGAIILYHVLGRETVKPERVRAADLPSTG